MANKRFIDFPIATTVGDNDIILIWQSGANKQTTKATILSGVPDSLNDLTDVTISGLTNGQILRYDSVSGQWENTDQGNLDLNDLNDVTIVSPTNGQVLVYNSSTSKWENSSGGYVPYTGAVTTVNLGAQTIQAGSFVKAGGTSSQFLKADGSVDSTAYGTGSVTSVALTMPTAFSVAGSPITTAGTLAVTGAGTVAQYIRGDGSLADFPETSGGGSSVSYYLNGSVAQGTIGGVAYKEMNKVPILGAGTDFTINANGYIASFITDAGDPNLLEIPGGNWNFETYFSANNGGGSPTFYVELYKVNSGGTATLIASNSAIPELIAFGTNITAYFTTLAVPTTTLALTDRLAVRYYVTHSGRTITMHTEGPHLCQIITTFTTGLTALNGLTAQVQNFAVGTTGMDFNIASAVSTHTFNLPNASATNRGALSSADWSLFTQAYNDKINSAAITGTTTKTLTLTQQDGGTITASWSDLNTDAVLSVFGRTGAVVAANGDYTTAQVTESGNLYYTDARSRAALSFAAGSGAYNTSTGVITIPTNNNQITNGAGYITSAALAGYLPLTGGNLTGPLGVTGNLTLIAGGSGPSFNRQISLGSGTAYNYQVRANGDDFQLIEAGSHVFLEYDYGGSLGAGTIRIYNNTVSTASFTGSSFIRSGGTSSQYLMADGSVSTLTNPVTGTGTTNYLPKFTGSTTIGNSIVQDTGTRIDVAGVLRLTPSSTTDIQAYTGSAYSNLFYDAASHNWQTSGGTAKMTLTAGGNLLVGTTTDNGAKLQVSGAVRASGSGNIAIIAESSNNFPLFQLLDNRVGGNNWNIEGGRTIGNLQFRSSIAGDTVFSLASTGAATFSSSMTAGGNINIYSSVIPSIVALTPTFWGYSSSYPVVMLGSSASASTVAIGYNPSGNANGSFTGNGDEILFRNGAKFTTPNSANNSFYLNHLVLKDGNVGIGTNNPQLKFVVSNGGAAGFEVNPTGNASGVDILSYNRSTSAYSQLTIDGSVLVFNTNASPRMTITSGGNVLINTTSDNGNRLRVNGTIFSDSSITATSFFESSDATLKTLIADNYQAKGIDSVVAKLYIKNGKEELGYFAQDLQTVLPSAVSKGSDGLLNLSYREVHTAKIAYLEEEIRQIKKRYEIN